ncbi:MAG: asparagine synthase (glutamine-hydrolyzing) [Myxococcales bacterium]
MCGFVGLLNLDGEPAQAEFLSGMSQSLAHRGPDDDGLEILGPCGLAFRRLSIIDLSPGGHQPMRSPDGRFTVVFNGEIYNHRELRAELQAQGVEFRSRSDTEVLLHLYRREASRMLHRLRGMFAFAIWDQTEQSLFLARDRVGIKPLYVLGMPGRRFYFASEIKAIIADPRVKRTLDPRALIQYLMFAHSAAPITMFAGIEKLPAGHFVTIKDGQVTKQRYWDVLDTLVPGDDRPVEVRDLLEDSVSAHMVSDVPVGAFLSGGVDSSALVSMMSDVAPPVQTFSVGFDVGGSYNELAPAREIARLFGTTHHELVVSYEDAASLIGKLVHHYDEPFSDAAALPTYMVARFARERVKVVMSGEGSDELFGGYRRYALESLAGLMQRTPRPVRAAAQRLLQALGSRRSARRLAGFLAEDQKAERYGGFLAQMEWDLMGRLLRPETLDAAGDYDPLWTYKERFARAASLDTLNQLLYTDFSTWMVDTYLEKVDKATMAVGLEARVPFLDHKLVEAAFRIPGGRKIRGTITKYPLKMAMIGTLPLKTLFKPKHGFSVPTDEWLRGPLRGLVTDTVLSPQARLNEWLDPAVVKDVCEGHFEGWRTNGAAVWTLLNFELWARHCLVAPTPVSAC